MDKKRAINLLTYLNIIDLFGISLALFAAFLFQFILKELPCPLCLLQRLGLLGISFGFLLNVRYCVKPNHYAFILLAAIFTASVALRQVLLHIVPGSGAYGDAFLGLHLYTWMFLLSVIIVFYTAIMLCIPDKYTYHDLTEQPAILRKLSYLAFMCLFALAIANVVSTWLECGLTACPDSPTQYKVLS
ncbi:MAG: dsbB 1 [Gammaproteobacteria bacterium]|jgi:disulfide bond formation protein DsbB|nr:dsbB 1 [Gammaproteobacteria bacterium]